MSRGKASKLVSKTINGVCGVLGFTIYYRYMKPKHIIEQARIHYRFHRKGIPHKLNDPSGPLPKYVRDIGKNSNGSKT